MGHGEKKKCEMNKFIKNRFAGKKNGGKKEIVESEKRKNLNGLRKDNPRRKPDQISKYDYIVERSLLENFGELPTGFRFGEVSFVGNSIFRDYPDFTSLPHSSPSHPGLAIKAGSHEMVLGSSKVENRDTDDPSLFFVESNDCPEVLMCPTVFLLKSRIPVPYHFLDFSKAKPHTISEKKQSELHKALERFHQLILKGKRS